MTRAIAASLLRDSGDEITPRSERSECALEGGMLTKKNRQFLANPAGTCYCFSERSVSSTRTLRGRRANGTLALGRAASGRNRHPEERSDAAIQESRGALRSPGLLGFARHGAAGSTGIQYVLRTGNDLVSVPQAIENAENGLGNGKPSACVFSLGDLIMRAPYCPSLAPNVFGRGGA